MPIILLSSRGEEALRLRGFSAGADDFVIKPFSMLELIARVRALLRRSQFAVVNQIIIRGDLQLDQETRRVRRGLREVRLSRTEFRLLDCLLERPGNMLSREQLLERVWDSAGITDRAIDVHVGRLRKALSLGCERDPILTVRGVGYAFDETFGK
jgi:two-component system, OmpR family, phosphate regulon response regulator PhoB